MKCPKCAHVNAIDADACAKCKFDIRYLWDRIYLGSQFVFLDASEAKPIAVTLDQGERTLTAPTIVSRHRHSVRFEAKSPTAQEGSFLPFLRRQRRTLSPLDFPKLEMLTLNLVAVVTDRVIYRPEDEVNIFIVGLNAPGKEVELEIKLAGQRVYQDKLALNEAGLALHRFGDLEEGEYNVVVTVPEQEVRAECAFSVAEYTLSPLIATLEAHQFDGKILRFLFKIMQLSVPYEGRAQLGLQCGVCNNRVVATKEVKVREGLVESEFDISGHGGPFTVQITTPGGETAAVAFPSTRYDERKRLTLSPMGRTAEAALLPFEGATEVRGLHYRYSGAASTPFILEEVVARRGQVKVATEASLVQLVVFDPIARRSRLLEFRDVSKGIILEFEVGSPYVIFILGAITKQGPYEAWGTIIRPMDWEATLDAPQRAEPGEEIVVRVETSQPASCLLLAYDARLEHESPRPKLAKRIFESMREGTRDLSEGEVKSIGTWEKKREADVLFAAAEPLAMRAMIRPTGPFRLRSVAAAPALIAEALLEEALEAPPARQEFPELAYIDLFPIEAAVERRVTLGDQIGTWRCRAYLFRGYDCLELTEDVEASKELYAELDLPAIVGQGDEIQASVRYHAPGGATLTVTTATERVVETVSGEGDLEFPLRAPSEVIAELVGETASDTSSRVVDPPGAQKVTASRLHILERGETVAGKRVVVYPSVGQVLSETIEALIHYPFG